MFQTGASLSGVVDQYKRILDCSISYTLFPLVFGQKGLCQDQTVSDCTDGRLIWFLLPLYIEETRHRQMQSFFG